MVFNSNDPCGGAGVQADILAIGSVGAHSLPVVTGTYVRDTGDIFEHYALDDEAVTAQARAVLEDLPIQIIKIGFAGSPENISAIAEVLSDYEDVPVVAYMPNLSWWEDDAIESYLDAFKEMVLPQTTILVGNYNTLWRWLLPDWASQRPPEPRDLARAADAMGTPYTLVTGIPLPEQWTDNALSSANEILVREKFARKPAIYLGAGDTLSAALAALVASGVDLAGATTEALGYVDRCLDAAFRPGMGHVVPDRLFWAQPQSIELDTDDDDDAITVTPFLDPDEPPHDLKH